MSLVFKDVQSESKEIPFIRFENNDEHSVTHSGPLVFARQFFGVSLKSNNNNLNLGWYGITIDTGT